MPKERTIGLYRYNEVTGYWNLERMCGEAIAPVWLTVFSQDEPNVQFKLSKRRPSNATN